MSRNYRATNHYTADYFVKVRGLHPLEASCCYAMRKYRLDKGMTSDEMAEQLGISSALCRLIDNGYRAPQMPVIYNFHLLSGWSYAKILGF